jgi:MFS family permease
MAEEKDDMQNVYRLGFVSFFTDVSSEMVFSILPVFILNLPGGGIAALGLIEGIAEALSYMLRAVSGLFSDMFRKRKIFILIGYGVSNIVKPFFAATTSVLGVLVIRVADRVGKGIRTSPRDALISDSVSISRSGTAFGIHRTLDQTGAILGPLTATFVMVYLGWTAREVFILSLLPGSIALVIILFGVREIVAERTREFKFLEGVRAVLRGRFLLLLGIVALFSLGAFDFSFILLNAKEMGVGDALIPIVYVVVNLAHTAIAIPAGRLSDRVGKEKVLGVGYAIFAMVAALLFVMPQSIPSAYLVAIVFGAYMGVVETIQRALVPGYVDASLKGTAYGAYYLVVGSAFFVANTAVGSLWQNFGVWASSLYSGILAVSALIGLLLFMRGTS